MPRPRITHAAEVHALHSFEFVHAALKPRSRVLEVGCGEGRLARRLKTAGHRVTAIDVDAKAIRKARRRGVAAHTVSFLDFDDARGFDAVVFVLSLHHILPSLARAITRARELLKPRGLLIADEFGRERMNRETARWFFEMLELVNASGALRLRAHDRHSRFSGPDVPHDPLERWRVHHEHDPPLHTGRSMRAAIGRRFRIITETAGPHLFRYPCRRLRAGAKGVAIARKVLEIESRRIAEGTLRAPGLRIVARKQ